MYVRICYVITDIRIFRYCNSSLFSVKDIDEIDTCDRCRKCHGYSSQRESVVNYPLWTFVVTSPASIYDVLSPYFPLLVPLCLSNSYALLKSYTYCLHVSSRFLTSILSSYSRSWTYYTNTCMIKYYVTHLHTMSSIYFSFCDRVTTYKTKMGVAMLHSASTLNIHVFLWILSSKYYVRKLNICI